MRFLHLIVVAALVSAAAYVYKVKFDSTLQAERVAKLRADLRHERDELLAKVAKLQRFGSQPVQFSLQYEHNFVHDLVASSDTVRATVKFLAPNSLNKRS